MPAADRSGVIEAQEAFNAVGVGMYRLLSQGDTSITYIATMLTAVTYERVRAFNPQGRLESAEGRFNSVDFPYELSVSMRTLRESSYRSGAGTWFSAQITVNADGSATAAYNYDEEPEWDAPVDAIAYLKDQEKFARDEARQPEWLKQQLAEGRARLAARDVNGGDPEWKAFMSG